VQKRFNWVNKKAQKSQEYKRRKEGLVAPVDHPEGAQFNWAGKKAQKTQR